MILVLQSTQHVVDVLVVDAPVLAAVKQNAQVVRLGKVVHERLIDAGGVVLGRLAKVIVSTGVKPGVSSIDFSLRLDSYLRRGIRAPEAQQACKRNDCRNTSRNYSNTRRHS